MTPEETKSADKMKSTKNAVNKAPSGCRKDPAQKHVLSAKKAHTAKNHTLAHKELDAAHYALK